MSKEGVASVWLEVVPAADVLAQLPRAFDAPGAVSVTCLPHHSPGRAVEASTNVARLGYHPVPHLAARSITIRAELHSLLRKLQGAGVSGLFLVADDRHTPAGPYSWSDQHAEAVKKHSPDVSIGIAGYPEGQPRLAGNNSSAASRARRRWLSQLSLRCAFRWRPPASTSGRSAKAELSSPDGLGSPVRSRSRGWCPWERASASRSLKLARGTGIAGALAGRRSSEL
jgi:methylenetetrahydrofolate reductase (NADPH)